MHELFSAAASSRLPATTNEENKSQFGKNGARGMCGDTHTQSQTVGAHRKTITGASNNCFCNRCARSHLDVVVTGVVLGPRQQQWQQQHVII